MGYRRLCINTDKTPANGEAIAKLKKKGLLPKETRHRQVKYLNNRLEGDHGKLKPLIKPTPGFMLAPAGLRLIVSVHIYTPTM